MIDTRNLGSYLAGDAAALVVEISPPSRTEKKRPGNEDADFRFSRLAAEGICSVLEALELYAADCVPTAALETLARAGVTRSAYALAWLCFGHVKPLSFRKRLGFDLLRDLTESLRQWCAEEHEDLPSSFRVFSEALNANRQTRNNRRSRERNRVQRDRRNP